MGLIWLGAAFVLLFVGQTINRLPRDFLILREHLREKDWKEFSVHLAECSFFWIGSIIVIDMFILPLLDFQIVGWSKIWEIFRSLGR